MSNIEKQKELAVDRLCMQFLGCVSFEVSSLALGELRRLVRKTFSAGEDFQQEVESLND